MERRPPPSDGATYEARPGPGDRTDAWLKAVLDAVPAAAYLVDDNDRMLYVNRWWEALFGRTRTDVVGKSVRDLFPPETADRLCRANREVFQTRTAVETEDITPREDGPGKLVWLRFPLPRRPGEPAVLCGISAETAEPHRAETSPRRLPPPSEALLRSVPDIIAEVDADKVYTWMNQAGLDFFGPDAIGREAACYFEGEQDTYEKIQPLFDGDESVFYAESWQRRRDGAKRLLAWWCRVLKDPAGEVIGALSTARDVTEQRRIEESLRESARQWNATFDAMADAVCLVSLDGTLRRCNAAVSRMFHRRTDELVGRRCYDVIHGASGFVEGCPFVRMQRTGRPESHEFRAGDRWFASSAVPVYDDDGALVAGTCSISDVTERKRLEEQFRQSQKMEAVGRLAGGIAHDFNNKLGVVMSYCDLVLRELGPDPFARPAIQEILRAAEDAAVLTNQLLTFSRKQPVQPKVLNLNAMVRRLRGPLGRLLGEDVALSAQLASGLGNVLVDPTHMEQVILNLAVNARDAMPEGGELTVATANVDTADPAADPGEPPVARPYVVLTVADTGSGMDARTLEHIFDPFFTTKEVGQGTGLGLSTVYGIVAQAKGDIEVASEPGRGTSFRISLPRVDAAVEDDRGDLAEVPLPRGTETILVVEDDDQVRQVVVLVLHQCGYTVLHAANHQQALPLAEHYQGRIDLLVTDVVMPGMSGPELARRVRAVRPRIGVLYVSGHASDAMTSYGMDIAEVNLLRKPFAPAVLAKEVRRLLNRAGSDRPVA